MNKLKEEEAKKNKKVKRIGSRNQPLKPIKPSKLSQSRSSDNRRDYSRQRNTAPNSALDQFRSRSSIKRPNYETACIFSKRPRHRSSSPDTWNTGDSQASKDNNATPPVSASNSQCEHRIDEPAPFIMGTLKNVDDSCYMNSLLYILRMTPTFVHSIHHLLENMQYLSDEYDENIGNTVDPGECLQSNATSLMVLNKEKWPNVLNINEPQKEVVMQLHRIFRKLTAREKRQDDEPLEKGDFQAAIRKIAPNLAEGRQQDTHAFLLILLNCIRECSAPLMQLVEKHASMFENIFDPATRLSFDLIEKNFIGKELTTTKFLCCGTTSDRTDDVMYFYIPLTEENEFGKHFIRESCLTREYLYEIKCEQCQYSHESMQLKSYPQLPRVLIFQLGRFDNELNKIHTITPTPLQLDCFCTPCMNNRQSDECIDHKYRLYGVIIHLGTTPRSGHYTAYARTFNDNKQTQQQQDVKRQCTSDDCCQLKFQEVNTEDNPDMENGFWYNCNDESIDVISEIDFQTLINRKDSNGTPYILFYVRNDHLANY